MLRLLIALSLAVPVAATPASSGRIEAHTRFLADDALEGRGIGTRGHEIAAAYVASQFAALGLTPGGTTGWQQRIQFERRSFAGSGETVTLRRGDRSRAFANGPDVRVAPGTAAWAERIEAGLVFVGFGRDAPTLGIDDYAGLDVAGKIVVALSGAPLAMDSEVGASLDRSKGEAAAKRGAAGLIVVRTLADIARRPWSKIAGVARQPGFGWLGPDGRPDAAAPLSLSATAGDALAAALFEGAPRSFAELQAEVAASPSAAPRGFALGGTLRLDRATALDRIVSPNVIGILPGSAPVLRDQFVVLMAHADHLGIRPHPSGDAIYNGAQDNAAGVAMLLEVARHFATAPRRPKRSLMFIVTTAEEVGLQGADYFARHPTVAIERIASVVDLDMPVLTCSFGEVVAYGASHSTLGADIAAVARKLRIGVAPDPQPIEAIFTRSDHYRFVRAGVPALFIKTGPGDSAGGTACGAADTAFRRTHYHEPSDDMRQPFDWAAAARFADLNIALTRRIANAPGRPRWYAGDFFGDSFAPAAAKAAR